MLRSTDAHSDSLNDVQPDRARATKDPNRWVLLTVVLLIAAAGSFVGTYIRLRQIAVSVAAAFCVFVCGHLTTRWVRRYQPRQPGRPSKTHWEMNSVYNRKLAQYKRMANRLAMYAMTPNEFEQFVLKYFEYCGFDTETTPPTGDGGIDGIVRRAGCVALVQCKRYRKPIAQAPLREFLGVLTKANADTGYFVTTSSFGPGARRFARGTIINLIDGETLVCMIQALPYLSPTTGTPIR
ncbi:MAG: hypothetical protein DHS20C16_14200 [Phycisphaerae bacterium]|nr:MAG: hypothetical protein DHS20C16_14200 [Phycisphaerae bacterium]